MKVEDLDFGPHPAGLGGTKATVRFDNGYGASVITGGMFYTSDEAPYELAVLLDGHLNYDTHITNDVLGHLTADDVEKHLVEIAELPVVPTSEVKH